MIFRKNNVKANIFLGILVLYAVSTVIHNVISIFLEKPELLFLNSINGSINFTFGPVLLAYLALIQGKHIRSEVKSLWHFVPSVLTFLSSGYYIMIPYTEKVIVMNKVQAGEEPFFNVMSLLLLIHFCCYLYVGWKKVSQYKEKAIDLGMDEITISVKWQRAFLLCLISLNLLLLLAYVVPVLITGKSHVYLDLLAVPVASLFMYGFMLYKGLSYHAIYNKPAYQAFSETVTPLNNFIEEVEILTKAKTAHRDELNSDVNLQLRLQQLFDIEKIHTKTGLKLYDVAELLHVRPAVLSTFINTQLKMTFFEMVNRYRVEEAKQMLIHKDYQRYKVEYIAEISGFNSRASFFRVFKKHLGKTPQEFREEYFLNSEKYAEQS
ncbi:helix-turn-helix domain-containing protein [Sphingobacterium lumbrici]|uniref:helix-turn-helix domain-containing protein n=1 Tax=Sphingobacterium lumbrici TaxID=2559600 RepID=UPI0015E337EC|nr:AraC family transcriptional regulator [Sphingobacterium lumbrici]